MRCPVQYGSRTRRPTLPSPHLARLEKYLSQPHGRLNATCHSGCIVSGHRQAVNNCLILQLANKEGETLPNCTKGELSMSI